MRGVSQADSFLMELDERLRRFAYKNYALFNFSGASLRPPLKMQACCRMLLLGTPRVLIIFGFLGGGFLNWIGFKVSLNYAAPCVQEMKNEDEVHEAFAELFLLKSY